MRAIFSSLFQNIATYFPLYLVLLPKAEGANHYRNGRAEEKIVHSAKSAQQQSGEKVLGILPARAETRTLKTFPGKSGKVKLCLLAVQSTGFYRK